MNMGVDIYVADSRRADKVWSRRCQATPDKRTDRFAECRPGCIQGAGKSQSALGATGVRFPGGLSA